MANRVAAIGLVLLVVGVVFTPIAAGSEHSLNRAEPIDAGVMSTASSPLVVAENASSALASAPPLFSVETSDFDRTTFSIEVEENASAQWTFRYTRNLENETERSNFEAFASDFNENETALYTGFVDQAQALTQSGTNVTGRSMDAIAFSRSGRVSPLGNRGVVEMTFTWTQFGRHVGDRVIVSDVFQGGLYVRSDQSLQFVAGPNLAFDVVDPLPPNTSESALAEREAITWVGERTFSDRHPYVAFQPASAVGTTTTQSTTVDTTTVGDGTTTAAEGTTTVGSGDDTTTSTVTGPPSTTTVGGGTSSGMGLSLVLAALGLIALGIVTAAWINGYFDPDDDGGVAADTGGPGDSSAPETPDESTSGSVESTELLTDSDRVVQLLEDRGGRMKQTEIVDATEWSKSKVSMLLSDMEDEDAITKLRVGRENIISLPGAEPEAARSPFEDVDE